MRMEEVNPLERVCDLVFAPREYYRNQILTQTTQGLGALTRCM